MAPFTHEPRLPRFPPEPPDGRQVYVVRFPLQAGDPSVANLESVLSPAERSRAARFHFFRDRYRFVTCRYCLRSLLAGYLRVHPAEIGFCYTALGKPELAYPANRSGLTFNLSHSHDLALIAVGREWPLGVDIEWRQARAAFEDLAQGYFSQDERAALAALPEDDQGIAFFDAWTRKEAYLKAIGQGLSYGLDRFSVSLRPGDRSALCHDANNPTAPEAWRIAALSIARGYSAALAVPTPVSDIGCYDGSALLDNTPALGDRANQPVSTS